MKRLLALIFVGMALPLFADNNSNDRELLKHLRQIQSELHSVLNENIVNRKADLSRMSQEDVEGCVFAWTILEEFYRQAKVLQAMVIAERAQYELEAVCNNIGLGFVEIEDKFDGLLPYQKMKTMVPVEGGVRAQDPVEVSENVKQELFELFKPIFTKVYQQHRARFIHEKGKSTLFEEDTVTDALIKQCFDDLLDTIIWYPEALTYDWPLLKLVDAKIAELEAQIK